MKRIQFNTGRWYTEHGQRIVAVLDGDILYFNDIDRGISGMYNIPDWDEWFALNEQNVMMIYDHNLSRPFPDGIHTFSKEQVLKIEDLLIWVEPNN